MASHQPETSLTFIVPGLLDAECIDRGLPETPRALATLLSRANAEPFAGSNVVDSLARLFPQLSAGLNAAAALRYLDDTGETPPGYCLAADPIHLQVGREQIIMGAREDMEITADEANALRDLLEADITRQGARLEITRPDHWYLFPATTPEADFAPDRDLAGKGIRDHMPSGVNAGPWRTLISDAQILLHECAPNQQRTAEGKVPVNSLWLWGGGALPEAPDVRSPWTTAASDDAVVRGGARLAGCGHVMAVPKDFGDWPLNGPGLIAFARPTRLDGEAWRQTVAELEERWFRPLLDPLSQKALAELNLIALNGKRYRITPRLIRRWWKRAHPLRAFT